MKTLWTRQGHSTRVSDIDYTYLIAFTWTRHKKGYFYGRSQEVRNKKLHRVVASRMGLDLTKFIDHRDRDKSNNCRSNLRPATNGMNRANSKRNDNNKSGFKGVHRRKSRPIPVGRKVRSDRLSEIWIAQINVNGKKIHLGQFVTPSEAHRAYAKAAKHHFGEYANV